MPGFVIPGVLLDVGVDVGLVQVGVVPTEEELDEGV